MKKLLILASVVAGTVLPSAPPASANETPCIVCDEQGCPRIAPCSDMTIEELLCTILAIIQGGDIPSSADCPPSGS